MTHLIDWAIVGICLLLIFFAPYWSFKRLLGKYLLVPAVYAACVDQAGQQHNLVLDGLIVIVWLAFMVRLMFVWLGLRSRQLKHEDFVRRLSSKS